MSSKEPKVARNVGRTLHGLIAALLVFAGTMKAFVPLSPEMESEMAKSGLTDHLKLIGLGEMAAAALLVLPWTASLGLLAVSGFWGGVISHHMGHGDPYWPGCVGLALTWIGGYLRGTVRMGPGPVVAEREKAGPA